MNFLPRTLAGNVVYVCNCNEIMHFVACSAVLLLIYIHQRTYISKWNWICNASFIYYTLLIEEDHISVHRVWYLPDKPKRYTGFVYMGGTRSCGPINPIFNTDRPMANMSLLTKFELFKHNCTQNVLTYDHHLCWYLSLYTNSKQHYQKLTSLVHRVRYLP